MENFKNTSDLQTNKLKFCVDFHRRQEYGECQKSHKCALTDICAPEFKLD